MRTRLRTCSLSRCTSRRTTSYRRTFCTSTPPRTRSGSLTERCRPRNGSTVWSTTTAPSTWAPICKYKFKRMPLIRVFIRIPINCLPLLSWMFHRDLLPLVTRSDVGLAAESTTGISVIKMGKKRLCNAQKSASGYCENTANSLVLPVCSLGASE